jgi:predicted nucleotidyltransferase
MTHFNWENCPQTVKTQITNFVDKLQAALTDNLTGIYLHGSLAMGCFNPASSDIDMLIVTETPLTPQQQRSMAQITLDNSGKPVEFEMSSIARTYLQEWEHPCRYDFHFSEDWRDKVTAKLANGDAETWDVPQGRDDDLAAHVTVTYHRGVVLYGQPIKDVIPNIPSAHYQDSIVGDFYWLLKRDLHYRPYGILNMCRVLQFLKTGVVSSKAEGGAWALANIPENYHAVIVAALANYRDNVPLPENKSAYDSFVTFMAQQIESVG